MSEPTLQPEPDESSAAAGPSAKAPRPHRRWYRKKRYLIPLGLLAVSAVVIGPWPSAASPRGSLSCPSPAPALAGSPKNTLASLRSGRSMR